MDRPKHYCGIFGILGTSDAARQTYYGLHALQHRGQESAGIATVTFDERKLRMTMPNHKAFGLVLDVFDDPQLFEDKLLGDAAIGHTRYSTSGASTNQANIQPFTVQYKGGNIALAHNGNLTNTRELRRSFVERGTLFRTSTDSELVLHLIAQSRREKQFDRIVDAVTQVEGAFCLVLLTDEALYAIRDPSGFRPLALGKKLNADGSLSWCVASETCAFDINGAEYVRDIEPGEILMIDRQNASTGDFKSYRLPQRHGTSQCVFEYVYFARPDSKIFGNMTDKVRRKMGKQLAHEAPVPAASSDGRRPIVISVPDSSNTAALGYVTENLKLGNDCRYEIGLIRNHYVGRTFIQPGQDAREQKVRIKFNTVDGVLEGRSVVLVDDSIVRGTTAKLLVKMVREAGAEQVHFRVSSPPVIGPCYYGMDFPTEGELLANQFDSVEHMADWLGVDSLAYLSVDGMMEAARKAHDTAFNFCNACFTKQYPVPIESGVTKEEND